jgi:hypothetical protein
MRRTLRLLGVTVAVLLGLSAGASAQVPVGNHYQCHKVKDLKVPAKFVPFVGVTAFDQTGAFIGEAKKPFLLCNPANKNGSLIVDPALHYCCYKWKTTAKVKASYDVTDQFGAMRLETKKPFLLCNPCSKVLAP